MATIISKVNTGYVGFMVNGATRNVGTGIPRFTVWRVLIEGAYYHIRVAGNPNFQIGADVNLDAINYYYSNINGNQLADQTDPSGDAGDGSSGNNNGGDLPDADDSANYPKDDGALQ